jgi:hypothetical protein
MSYIHRTMIVPAGALTSLAQGLCEGLAGEAGKGMFVTELSPTGNEPATHYISSGPIDDSFANLLPLTSVDSKGVSTTTSGNSAGVVYLASQKEIVITLEQIAELFSAIDVSEQPPFIAMARLGIEIVRKPLS